MDAMFLRLIDLPSPLAAEVWLSAQRTSPPL